MAYDPTPRLSPTTSLDSTDSLVTPNHSDTSIFIDDRAVSEDVPDGHFLLFKNSSEVWEEFKDVGCDPLGTLVADAGIPMSSSSSLLSGIDLLEDTSPPLLPEVAAAPIPPESHQVVVPRRASLFDFPSPPILVPDRRTTMRESRSISGNPLMVSLVSHPAQGTSHECLPQPIRHSSALQRWSTLPSPAFDPDNRRRSSELVTSNTACTRTFRTWAAGGAVTRGDPLVVPFVSTLPSSGPRPAGRAHDVLSPLRRLKPQKASDKFTSFMDMSPDESTLSESRIDKIFSKISSSFKSRRKPQ